MGADRSQSRQWDQSLEKRARLRNFLTSAIYRVSTSRSSRLKEDMQRARSLLFAVLLIRQQRPRRWLMLLLSAGIRKFIFGQTKKRRK
jgi:hypothetical protein